MRVALEESFREVAMTRLAGHDKTYFNSRVSPSDLVVQQLLNADVLALRWMLPFPLDRKLLASLPQLKLVHKSGTGLDGFELTALNEYGILLSNNKGLNASCVAEHVVLLTLLCLHNTFGYLNDMRNGIWQEAPRPSGISQLEGKTVGIVGLGEIGCQVAKQMAAFGVKVVAYQRHRRAEAEIFGDVRWLPLHELLRVSDVVTLNVPLTEQTHKLIGARELEMMKQTAVLINTSRGQVVDESALYEALTSRRIAAAGLDVFEQEPTPANNPLLKLENVLATPHIASDSMEMAHRQADATLRNVELFLAGQRPLHLANPEILDQGIARAKQWIQECELAQER